MKDKVPSSCGGARRSAQPLAGQRDINLMNWRTLLALLVLSLSTGCGKKDDSTYVLIRDGSVGYAGPALRAYFVDGDAHLNGIDCRELLTLANEAVEARKSRGETHLMKYECVSLREARERGFK